MQIFLVIVTIISYLTALLSATVGKSDIQLILSVLCVLTGTVSLIGLAILNRMTALAKLLIEKTEH